jgi:hypothetical protein
MCKQNFPLELKNKQIAVSLKKRLEVIAICIWF